MLQCVQDGPTVAPSRPTNDRPRTCRADGGKRQAARLGWVGTLDHPERVEPAVLIFTPAAGCRGFSWRLTSRLRGILQDPGVWPAASRDRLRRKHRRPELSGPAANWRAGPDAVGTARPLGRSLCRFRGGTPSASRRSYPDLGGLHRHGAQPHPTTHGSG